MGFALFDAASGGGPDYASIAQQQEQQRQQAITQGTQNINRAFAGFTPQFYQGRVKAYENFAMPQLSQQYQVNKNQVGFNLANRGIFGGSAANKQYGDLNTAMAQAQQGIADQGLAQANALQQQVEQQRNQLLGQLYQGADPSGAGAAAAQTAASFAQPSTFGPLANQFQNFANTYYLSQLINAYRPQQTGAMMGGGGGGPTYSGNAGALPAPAGTVSY